MKPTSSRFSTIVGCAKINITKFIISGDTDMKDSQAVEEMIQLIKAWDPFQYGEDFYETEPADVPLVHYTTQKTRYL